MSQFISVTQSPTFKYTSFEHYVCDVRPFRNAVLYIYSFSRRFEESSGCVGVKTFTLMIP